MARSSIDFTLPQIQQRKGGKLQKIEPISPALLLLCLAYLSHVLQARLTDSDFTGLVEVLVGWLVTLPKSQPVGAFFGFRLVSYRKFRLTG